MCCYDSTLICYYKLWKPKIYKIIECHIILKTQLFFYYFLELFFFYIKQKTVNFYILVYKLRQGNLNLLYEQVHQGPNKKTIDQFYRKEQKAKKKRKRIIF